jgi:hypothetical protein
MTPVIKIGIDVGACCGFAIIYVLENGPKGMVADRFR